MKEVNIRIETDSEADREKAVDRINKMYFDLMGRMYFECQLVARDVLIVEDSKHEPGHFTADGYNEFVYPLVETQPKKSDRKRLTSPDNPDFSMHQDTLEREYDPELPTGHIAVEFSNYGRVPMLRVSDLREDGNSELPPGVEKALEKLRQDPPSALAKDDQDPIV